MIYLALDLIWIIDPSIEKTHASVSIECLILVLSFCLFQEWSCEAQADPQLGV